MERTLFTKQYLADPTNITAFTRIPPPGVNPLASPPGQTNGFASEDCLFLDVIVPIGVFNKSAKNGDNGNRGSQSNVNHAKAPVLFRMFGGGFYLGSKNSEGNPAGLVGQSITHPSSAPGMIYVSINYRLGAMGWLAGPSFAAQGGQPNAGLHDERLALEWVQQYIHLFGGDPGRVTIGGSSAGASSSILQMTAYNGKGRGKVAPFQQAIPESPALNVNPYNWLQEKTFKTFLKAANVSTLAELRALPSEAIITANELTIWQAGYGSSGGYGPVIDGDFVPAPPALMLSQGRFSKNIKAIFTGHNTDEGLIFTPPNVQNDTALAAFLHLGLVPDAPAPVLAEIQDTLYPPEAGIKTPYHYNDTISRTSTIIADYLLNCNVQALLSAFGVNQSWAYLFEEGESLHGEELPYWFYNYGPTKDNYGYGKVNGTVAKGQQDWIVTFVASGDPNAEGNAPMPTYGEGQEMGLMANRGLGVSVKDPATKERCAFWNSAVYY